MFCWFKTKLFFFKITLLKISVFVFIAIISAILYIFYLKKAKNSNNDNVSSQSSTLKDTTVAAQYKQFNEASPLPLPQHYLQTDVSVE